MRKNIFLLILILFVVPVFVFAQTGNIQGRVVDESTGEGIPGANVIVEGTTLGAATDSDGNFLIANVPVGRARIMVTVIGFEKVVKNVEVVEDQKASVSVAMRSTVLKLSEVVVQGNIAKDRETPVAFTDVSEDHIRQNFTVQDVPHLFANTPGIYVMTDGGSGMGDSKVVIRGFDEQRISVMINNVPVNDPESKKVYWSNWGSLPAAAQSIQIQRGVGSSLYGSGALGGSINVVTKDAPADKSLGFSFSGGQYGIMKLGVDYNTGLIGGKMAFVGRFNYLQGNGWRQDTFYRGIQYYLSAMLFPNERNTLKIILHGAPQYHAYSYYGFPAKDFMKYGRDWNGHPHVDEDELKDTDYEDRGTKLFDVLFNRIKVGTKFEDQKAGLVIGNGRASLDNNVYNKPQFEVHHSLKLSKNSKLTNTAFFSRGFGYGENLNGYYMVAREDDGNMAYAGIDTAGQYQYRNYAVNIQSGILSSFDTKLGEHDLTIGVEGRWWRGYHAGEILNVFADSDGLISYYMGNVKQKFGESELYYEYTTTKPQFTTFAHALWRFGNLNIMTDAQYSIMKYHVVEGLPSGSNYPDDPEPHGGDTWTGTALDNNGDPIEYILWDHERTFSFVSPKLGANYNLTKDINVFANWSQAYNEPRIKYFFAYGSPNEALKLEQTSDIELGAGYKGEIADIPLNAKYNFYHIAFQGKALQITDPEKANTPGYDYKGRQYIPIGESTYSGHELAVNADLPFNFKVGLNMSLSSNLWGEPEDSQGAQYLYSADDVVAGVDFADTLSGAPAYKGYDGNGKWDTGEQALHKKFVDKFDRKVEVGMPQAIFGGTINYSIGGFFINTALRHYRDIYVLENNSKVIVEVDKDGNSVKESETIPPATVVDMVLGYRLAAAGFPINVSLHIVNLFDTEYWQIGDSYGFLPGAARTIILNTSVTL